MDEPEYVELRRLELDRTEDPRGGAAAWALVVVGCTLVAATIATVLAL
jgi:hypothetical protein